MWLLFDSSFALSAMNQYPFNRDKCIAERNYFLFMIVGHLPHFNDMLCCLISWHEVKYKKIEVYNLQFFFPSIKISCKVHIQCSYRILIFIDWVNNLHISYNFSHNILNLSQIWSTLKENDFWIKVLTFCISTSESRLKVKTAVFLVAQFYFCKISAKTQQKNSKITIIMMRAIPFIANLGVCIHCESWWLKKNVFSED